MREMAGSAAQPAARYRKVRRGSFILRRLRPSSPQADQVLAVLGHSHTATATAASIPTSCATTNANTPAGAIPANVSDRERAMVTAGLANDVDAVNQYAEVM